MKHIRLYSSANLLVCVALIGLVGCTGANAKALQGSERDAVLAYSEPIADNLLQGMNAADYAAFSRDFNDQMKKGITQQSFQSNLLTTIGGKLGKYVSRQVSSVSQVGSNLLVIYTAKFEQDDNVTIRLSLEQADPHHVSGLYFNSAKLSAK
jgi:hypothetical protein